MNSKGGKDAFSENGGGQDGGEGRRRYYVSICLRRTIEDEFLHLCYLEWIYSIELHKSKENRVKRT